MKLIKILTINIFALWFIAPLVYAQESTNAVTKDKITVKGWVLADRICAKKLSAFLEIYGPNTKPSQECLQNCNETNRCIVFYLAAEDNGAKSPFVVGQASNAEKLRDYCGKYVTAEIVLLPLDTNDEKTRTRRVRIESVKEGSPPS